MWSVIAQKQRVEVTGDGTEAVTDSVALDPEPGWGGRDPTGCQGGREQGNVEHSVGHPPPNILPQQNHPLQEQRAVVTRN